MADDPPVTSRPPARPRFAVVNWSYPDGSTVAGCPLPYRQAEALARAYMEFHPGRRAWLTVPRMVAALQEEG